MPPTTSHLGGLIDEYLRRHSATSVSALAERIGISRQTLRQWRVGELRSLPAQEYLSAAATEIGCSYGQLLDAALRDVGYLGAGDSGAVDSAAPTAAEAFIESALVAERYSGAAGERMREWARGPAIWTVAHRGYSGNRRLDVWAYPSEASALQAAARLGLDCGLDEDEAAVKAFARHDYPAVLDRHRQTAPDWQILAVTLVPFVGKDGQLIVTSAGLDHSPGHRAGCEHKLRWKC